MENIIDLAEKYHELQEKEDAFFDEANKTEIKQEKDVIIKQAVTLSLENNKDDLKSFKIALWSSWSALEKIQKEKNIFLIKLFQQLKMDLIIGNKNLLQNLRKNLIYKIKIKLLKNFKKLVKNMQVKNSQQCQDKSNLKCVMTYLNASRKNQH